ncbi:MAG: hypothetical protein ACRCY8_03145, partial [Dermatophilaceae bacterium]
MRDAADDFGAFVAARWSDLEAVALLATLDLDLAREVTVATLAAVHRDWADTVDSGAPVARCRVELLTRLGRLATPRPGDPSDADRMAPATDHTAPATTVARPDLLGPSTDDEER